MDQESAESDDENEKRPQGSMVLNELAQFDDNQPAENKYEEDENLLADDQ